MMALLLLLFSTTWAQSITFPGQVFSPYPDYTGGLAVSASSIDLDFSVADEVTITYTNLIADDTCTTADTAANSCGIHIHSGSSCATVDDVGGHFFATADDPWLTAAYTPGSGSLTVIFGYGYDDSKGLAFVLHDRTGARISCELLVSPLTTLTYSGSATSTLGVYPGYTDGLVASASSISIDFGCPTCTNGLAMFSFADVVADPACDAGPSGAGNSCGIHIHEGFTCDTAAGHFYMGTTDPWSSIVYGAGGTNEVLVDMGGYGYLDTVGRVVNVHDIDGNRVACVNLLENTNTIQTAGPLALYPDYSGSISVSATSVVLEFQDTSVDITYTNLVADATCTTPDDAFANSCGIHIHAGTTCLVADEVGGHHWNSSTLGSDPWANVVYVPGSGSVSVDSGFDYDSTVGRVLVIHNRNGTRISCTILVPTALGSSSVSGAMEVYPDYVGTDTVSSTSIRVAYRDDSVTIMYEDLVADATCTSADFGAGNSCGIHLHEGFSCEDANGHFFSSDLTDPWGVAYYTPGSGSVTVTHGLDHAATRGRVLVVHDRTGARIACTALNDLDSWVLDFTTMDVYPGYTGGQTVQLRAALMFTGSEVAIAYDIDEADPFCAFGADLDSANSCGIHLHTGSTCPTGGHFFEPSLSDPWGVAYYTPGSAGLLVNNGLSWTETTGLAAFVIHNLGGERIACATVCLSQSGCATDNSTVACLISSDTGYRQCTDTEVGYSLDVNGFTALASCDAGSSGVAPDCGTCDVEGFTGTSTWDGSAWSACAVATCATGSAGSAPDCSACDVDGYFGTSSWDGASWSACSLASCAEGASGTPPDCSVCDVPGFSGVSTWDATSASWSACTGASGYCPSINLSNGTVSCSSDTDREAGDVCTWSCDLGFSYLGTFEGDITCLVDTAETGVWSSTPSCTAIYGYCPLNSFGSASCSGASAYAGETCVVNCDNADNVGYNAPECLTDSQESGVWSFEPYCLAAAQCACSGNFVNSLADGSYCSTCLDGWEGENCDISTTVADSSNFCNGEDGLIAAVCYYHGTCDEAARICECSSGFDGKYCDSCNSTTQNYPSCDEPLCNHRDTCDTRGDCAPIPIECGFNGCDPLTEKCYSSGYERRCIPTELKGCGISNECQWFETCADTATGECCDRTHTACFAENDDGSRRLDPNTGLEIPGSCCLGTETCCDGVCCASDAKCVKQPEPQFGWVDADGNSLGYESRVCTSVKLTPVSGMRVVAVPFFLLCVSLGLFLPKLKNLVTGGGCNHMSIVLPTCIMYFCSIMLFFSPLWPHAILLSLVALMILFQIEQDEVSYTAWVISFVFFCIFIGGVNLGFLFGDVTENTNMFPALTDSETGNTFSNLFHFQEDCAKYYNYFYPDANILALTWDHDPSQSGINYYCSQEWIDATSFFVITIAGCYFYTLIQSFNLMAGQGYRKRA